MTLNVLKIKTMSLRTNISSKSSADLRHPGAGEGSTENGLRGPGHRNATCHEG